jgi:DNA polymerase I-like protein with 3'-5' exonuclease and polymerase domains
MVVMWVGKTPQAKVLSHLSPVLKNSQDVPVTVVNDCSVPSATKIILSLGSEPLKALQAAKYVPKNRTITSLRTMPIQHTEAGAPVLVTYNADIGEVDYRYHIDLLTDVSLAVRYYRTGSFLPQMGEYQYVSDLSQVIETIQKRYAETGMPVPVFLDLETVGLDPFRQPSKDHPGGYIVTLQVCPLIGTGYAVRFDSREESQARLRSNPLQEQITWLLNSPIVRTKGANLKYDLNWLWVQGKFECSNFIFDTTIVGSLFDENRSNSLDVHVKIYAPRLGAYSDEFDRQVNKSRMDLALKNSPSKFLSYACGDVDGGLEVSEVMKSELLKDQQLAGFYVNILHPAARAFEKIERGGVLVDMDAYQELKSDLEKEQVELIRQACRIMGGRIVAKHHDQSKVGGINLTKASLLGDFLFSKMGLNLKPKMWCAKEDKEGQKKPSTAMEHLEMFADDPDAKDFIAIMQNYAQVTKTYNTYVVGFLEHLRSDGRFHPTYYLFVGNRDEGEGGAATGRLSCHDPAFQTIPKHTKWAKRIRRCFPAPPGYVVVERDYSQGELRVIACIAACKAMIEVYRQGKDLHTKTAAGASKMSYEALAALKKEDEEQYDKLRQRGKAGNFGLCFGMGVEGFMVYAKRNYGVDFTWDEANDFRNAFFKEYAELLRYHEQYKAFARKFKHVRTPLGRIRHLPLISSPNREQVARCERQAINSPVQGCLTDMLLWCFALENVEGMSEVAPAFGAVHDAAYNYCPEDKVDIYVPKMLLIQENLPFEKVGWYPQLKFVADAKIGPNMADLKKYECKK